MGSEGNEAADNAPPPDGDGGFGAFAILMRNFPPLDCSDYEYNIHCLTYTDKQLKETAIT